ncbi:MFS transporter, partial [Eisenbergiella massiliensis]|uniref:MFS transporter n=2 Tax=Eisenbergiella TaxID=1432051 RepID=UPI0023F21D0D
SASMFENKRSQFLSVNVIIFFGGCTILFLISQLYSVLQVSLIMKGAGSVLLLSSVMTAMVVPRIFLLPVAGFLTDKAGVSRTLTGGTGILGILLVSLVVVNQVNAVNKYTVFIYAVLFGGISAAILPTLYSAVPGLVSGENLQKANSVMQFISQGSLLAGPLFAGIVIGKMSDLISGGSIILITIVILE